jgi:chromate transporter
MIGIWPATLGLTAPASKRWALFLFFLKSSLFVFGSGLAIVPFLHGGVVESHNWLTEHQFLDAIAVAMITPGPVVITRNTELLASGRASGDGDYDKR